MDVAGVKGLQRQRVTRKKKERKEEDGVEGWGGSTEPSKEQINRNGTLKQT